MLNMPFMLRPTAQEPRAAFYTAFRRRHRTKRAATPGVGGSRFPLAQVSSPHRTEQRIQIRQLLAGKVNLRRRDSIRHVLGLAGAGDG